MAKIKKTLLQKMLNLAVKELSRALDAKGYETTTPTGIILLKARKTEQIAVAVLSSGQIPEAMCQLAQAICQSGKRKTFPLPLPPGIQSVRKTTKKLSLRLVSTLHEWKFVRIFRFDVLLYS